MKPSWIRYSFLLVLLCGSTAAWARSSPNVPIGDPVYRDVDRLVGLGLARDVIYGQRPWSRAEIARLAVKAAERFAEIEPPLSPDDRELSVRIETEELLERMKRRFADEIEDQKTFVFHPLAAVRGEYVFVDQDARDVPRVNGLGAIDAFISPLTAYREGRHYPDGHQFAVETEHYALLTRFFSVYARPRFQMEIRDNKDVQANPFVQQLYGKFSIPHFELTFGRDSLAWGQAEFGGIFLSNNARPLDLVKISNPSPTVLPWVFRYLGPFRYTVFVANLGPEREFPRSFLTGFKLSLKPASFFEFGFSHMMVLGGEGAPSVSVGDAVSEFFMHRSGSRTSNKANHLIGMDLRFTIPPMRNTQFYFDAAFEDARDRVYMLKHLANYHFGIFVPRLDENGFLTLRLEYRHGSPYYARNGTFSTGLALNRRLLGDELGPDGDAVAAKLGWQVSERFRWDTELRFERRDANVLTETANFRGLITVLDVPAELRIGFANDFRFDFSERAALLLGLGYERIQSFHFVSGDNRNAFLTQVGARFEVF